MNEHDHKAYRLKEKLCCPLTHAKLRWYDNKVSSEDGSNTYAITPSGIPLFADEYCSVSAERQRKHYDQSFADNYLENLGYPHTQEYMSYLNSLFSSIVDKEDLGEVAEICCGHGEVISLFGKQLGVGIGVDVSQAMLEKAKITYGDYGNFIFVQGDATMLPLESNSFKSVIILGGIHHVPDREELFKEIFRVLKPGGRFYFREPVSDFFIWRWIRAMIYAISPSLDSETERPLLWKETVPILRKVGFLLKSWKTCGFIGFCFFMNSDVLIFNKGFRFIPGIRSITRFSSKIDEFILKGSSRISVGKNA
jgi:ubiquinone/menaquinone biosynthesis C-methylase UbiE